MRLQAFYDDRVVRDSIASLPEMEDLQLEFPPLPYPRGETGTRIQDEPFSPSSQAQAGSSRTGYGSTQAQRSM